MIVHGYMHTCSLAHTMHVKIQQNLVVLIKILGLNSNIDYAREFLQTSLIEFFLTETRNILLVITHLQFHNYVSHYSFVFIVGVCVFVHNKSLPAEHQTVTYPFADFNGCG